MGWVNTVRSLKQIEGGCQWHLCISMLTFELTAHMLIYIVRGHICCPLIHDSLLPSFLPHPHPCTPGRVCSQAGVAFVVIKMITINFDEIKTSILDCNKKVLITNRVRKECKYRLF